jgi:hypothetical protein
LRIRVVLSLGALLLAGGALTGGAVAMAQDAPAASPTTTAPAPTAVTVKPAPSATTRPAPPIMTTRPGRAAVRVPTAVPAGPTGDLALPAIVAVQ